MSSCHLERRSAHSRKNLLLSDWNRVSQRCDELTYCVAWPRPLGQNCPLGCFRRSDSVRRYDGRLVEVVLGEVARQEGCFSLQLLKHLDYLNFPDTH